ncbi:MAG TPA: M56 family metallopeptidase [Polyangiaceae bacterium]|nr:M56 family metallopeptidase [Polyangiaceae bacterium]
MSVAGDVLFNLLFNSLAAFWVALGASLLLFRAFRLDRSALGLGVLLLPFVKLVLEVARGVPPSSFLWLSERGVRQTLGEFRFGFGATREGPSLVAALWAEHAGGRAPESAADLATRLLRHKLGVHAAPALACVVLAVALGGLTRWAVRRRRASSAVRLLAERAAPLATRRLGRRTVRVLESAEHRGAPFAAGLRAPFVLLPSGLRERLSPLELEAVLAHELAHVARFDLVVLLVLGAFERLFWYVPGVGRAERRVAAFLERRADDAALAAGVTPGTLARALVVTAEFAYDAAASPEPAATGARSELGRRVRRLLEPGNAAPAVAASPRARALAGLRAVAVVWCALGILAAVAFGNHGG